MSSEFDLILQLLLACLVAAFMVGGFVLTLTPSPAQRQQWQQAEAHRYWQTLQATLTTGIAAELSQIAQVAPPPPGRPNATSELPPLYLYHGTPRSNLPSLLARGLEGRSAGVAFMAADEATARSFGRRRGREFIILRVLAQRAYQNGTAFQKRGSYFVTSSVHPAFIDFHWALADLAQRTQNPTS